MKKPDLHPCQPLSQTKGTDKQTEERGGINPTKPHLTPKKVGFNTPAQERTDTHLILLQWYVTANNTCDSFYPVFCYREQWQTRGPCNKEPDSLRQVFTLHLHCELQYIFTLHLHCELQYIFTLHQHCELHSHFKMKFCWLSA